MWCVLHHCNAVALKRTPSYPGARLRGNSFLLPKEKRTNAAGRFGLPKFRVYTGERTLAREPVPVAAVYFLRSGRTLSPKFAQLSPISAIKPFLKSSFIAALPKSERAREVFIRTTRLVSALPAFELRYRREAAHFDCLLDALIAQCRAQRSVLEQQRPPTSVRVA